MAQSTAIIMQKQSFSFKKRIASFRYAINGLRFFLQNEHNAWIHLLATILVVILGFILSLQGFEWLFILFAMSLVWVTEIINTAIEQLCNVISPEENSSIGRVKDLAAGAVLVAAIFAIITALIIFIPKILNLC